MLPTPIEGMVPGADIYIYIYVHAYVHIHMYVYVYIYAYTSAGYLEGISALRLLRCLSWVMPAAQLWGWRDSEKLPRPKSM